MNLEARGGIEGIEAQVSPAAREIFLLQRKTSKVGAGLGKTTGWIHRAGLQHKGVQMMPGCEYLKVDDDGLHIQVGDETKVLAVDNIVICAGQESERSLSEGLSKPFQLIGGSDVAAELDAKRAIDQGTRVAAAL
jgi:2,4-dienoyl-CoA reductase (NADPH2)